jgi:hypothetical protein
VVVELDRGRPDDAPTRGAKPDAKIDIVVRNGKSLIETALRKENIAADRETTRGHAGQILLETGSAEVSTKSARFAVKGVTRDTAQAQDDARMLNGRGNTSSPRQPPRRGAWRARPNVRAMRR